jgi:hypothetical protein
VICKLATEEITKGPLCQARKELPRQCAETIPPAKRPIAR